MIRIKEGKKNKAAFFSIDNATKNVRKGARQGLTEIGRENVKHTKGLIKKPPKTGRFYRFRGILHQASAPGQPPANRTGKLLRSVRYRVYSWNRMEFGYHAPYGKFLEDGTRKMEARPALGRTVDERSRENFNILQRSSGVKINR
jgi:hypothetical protein